MANTYSQCYFQLVFAVKNRNALITKNIKNDVERYITGIIKNNKHTLIAIYCMPDHIHILIGYDLNQSIPNLINEIKTSSTKWINENKLSPFKFEWQRGYGAFTYSHSQKNKVAKYIQNQEEHHKQRTFKEEYNLFLKEFEVEHNPDYLFEFFD